VALGLSPPLPRHCLQPLLGSPRLGENRARRGFIACRRL